MYNVDMIRGDHQRLFDEFTWFQEIGSIHTMHYILDDFNEVYENNIFDVRQRIPHAIFEGSYEIHFYDHYKPMFDWCTKNCTDKWGFHYAHRFVFYAQQDAIAFSLIWI